MANEELTLEEIYSYEFKKSFLGKEFITLDTDQGKVNVVLEENPDNPWNYDIREYYWTTNGLVNLPIGDLEEIIEDYEKIACKDAFDQPNLIKRLMDWLLQTPKPWQKVREDYQSRPEVPITIKHGNRIIKRWSWYADGFGWYHNDGRIWQMKRVQSQFLKRYEEAGGNPHAELYIPPNAKEKLFIPELTEEKLYLPDIE